MRIRRVLIAGVLSAAAVTVSGCHSSAPGPQTYRIYVTNETAGTLSVIDGASLKLMTSTPLGKRPRGLTPDPHGGGLVVTLSGSPIAPPGVDERTLPPPDRAADGLGIFDTNHRRMDRVLRGVDNPEQAIVSTRGIIYAPCEERGSLVLIDEASGGKLAELPVGDQPEGVALSPDGKRVYVALEGEDKLAVVDGDATSVLKRIPVGGRPRSLAVSKDGRRVYVADETGRALTVVDANTLAVAATVAFPEPDAKPMGLVLSPDGARVYVTTGRGGKLVAVDAANNAILGSVAVGARPWGVAVSPDGRYVFTANGPSNDVTVVSADRLAVVRKIKVDERPWGVAVAPAD